MSEKPYYNHDGTWQDRMDRRSPVWGHYSAVLYEHVLQVLSEQIAPNLSTPQENPEILDAGCGAGKFNEFAIAAGYKYVGIDESAVAIALGKTHWPRVDLRCADLAQSLQAEDLMGRFDVVTSLNVLHCLTEKPHRMQYLKNLKALAKADGLLFLSTMCGPIPGNYRASREPRVYLAAETIIEELAMAGWAQVSWKNELPAHDLNPIPNLELIARVMIGV